LVDDEAELLRQLEQALREQHYDPDTALDGEEALDKLFDQTYDLVILDIMLPKLDGLSVLAEMRRGKIDTPVLMLTAKGSVQDKVAGLDRGADDYLAKPFSVSELMARIRSLLRRFGASRDPVLSAPGVALDTRSQKVTVDGCMIGLTPKEYSLLEFLLYNKNRVVSRFSLAEHVWGDAFDPFSMSNFIDVHIRNLRRKLGADCDRKIIRTVRGVGFIIEDEERA
jgi:DNA-binding response OmpR family regulator